MQVETHNHLANPLRVPASRVVVYDDLGNPILYAITTGANRVRVGTAHDPDFLQQLKQLGISQTVVITRLDANKLSSSGLSP